jgi:hypothetical protein
MISVADLADEVGLSTAEVRAVAKMAGLNVSNATNHLDEASAQRIRDVLAGRVDVKPPRAPFPVAKIAISFGIVVLLIGVIAAIGAVVNRPAAISVQAGDCFDEPDLFAFRLDPVSCNGPHKYRAYARMDLALKFREEYGEAYPGRSVIEEHVKARCEALNTGQASDPFAGLGIVSTYEIYYFFPEEQAWKNGARSAVCATRE